MVLSRYAASCAALAVVTVTLGGCAGGTTTTTTTTTTASTTIRITTTTTSTTRTTTTGPPLCPQKNQTTKCPDGQTDCQDNNCCPDMTLCPSCDNAVTNPACPKKAFDCTVGHGPTPAPTPPPPTPPTPPTQPPYFIDPCKDAACCKKKIKDPEEAKICDDFYNQQMGIAVSMISMDTWQLKGAGSTGVDGVRFMKDPPVHIIPLPNSDKPDPSASQAISISHAWKQTWFYPQASRMGVLFPIRSDTKTWKYFTVGSVPPHYLCAECTDGRRFSLGGNPGQQANWAGDHVLMDYNSFAAQKQVFVDQAGTDNCKDAAGKIIQNKNQYNEFDSNGLSADDFIGIFRSYKEGQASRNPEPRDDEVCKFLKVKLPNATKTKWPVYDYHMDCDPPPCPAMSSLQVYRWIECGDSIDLVV